MADVSDLTERLQKSTAKRAKLSTTLERLLGSLEAATKQLDVVRNECLKKGVDPDNIDAVIAEKTAAFEAQVAELETGIANADKALSPYIKG